MTLEEMNDILDKMEEKVEAISDIIPLARPYTQTDRDNYEAKSHEFWQLMKELGDGYKDDLTTIQEYQHENPRRTREMSKTVSRALWTLVKVHERRTMLMEKWTIYMVLYKKHE